MNKKLVWSAVLLLNLCLLVFSSCSDDDDDNPTKPLVELKELGSGHDSPNDKEAYIGTNAHIEAEIVAEGLIKQISVEVHKKEGSYKFEKVYTDEKYVNKKNTTFHEHLDIPSDALAGSYHLHLTVVDLFGQSTTVESELTLKEVVSTIKIEGFTFGAGHDFPDNKIGYLGTAPVVEATSITAEDGIDKIVVGIHSEGATAAFELDTTFTYNSETELTKFHKHVLVPQNAPAGDYHLHFKVYDKKGKYVEKSMDIQFKETGITLTGIEIGQNNSAIASNIHTEFVAKTTDSLKSVRVRIYKASAPTTYFLNETYTDDFASGNVKDYTFHKHLQAVDAAPGEYIIDIRVSDNKGAYNVLKQKLTITA